MTLYDEFATESDRPETSESVGEIASIETIMAQIASRIRINELSPTARIPLEILTEIFQIACQLQVVENLNVHRQEVTPLFIGSICRLWRDVAWSTPLLWSTILLHVSRTPEHLCHGNTLIQVQLLEDWLLRARSAPLSITIELVAKDVDEYIICAFRTIMPVLVTRSDYWFTFDSPLVLPQFLHNFEDINFPLLTSLSLHHPTLCCCQTNVPPVMCLTAPKLVDVDSFPYNSPVVLPWPGEHIRCFTTGGTVTECLRVQVLRQSPNLQQFVSLYVCSLVTSISETIIPHAWPRAQLKHLCITLDNAESMSLFDNITLPSLTHLHIRNDGDQRVLFSSIKSLVLRSACMLERFLIECLFDFADLLPCLEAIPSLITLVMMMSDGPDTMGLTSHFVDSIGPINESSRLPLPNLEKFVYRGPVLCNCRTILGMMARRWYSPSYYDDADDENSQSISQLKVAKVSSTTRYHVTADVQYEIRFLLREEGFLVCIEELQG